jgi:hypothetical protein
VAIAVGMGVDQATDGRVWVFVSMTVAFLLSMIVISRIFAKKLNAIMTRIQGELEESQVEANRQVQRFMNKPMSSEKVMQRQIEKTVEKHITAALEIADEATPLFPWNLLAERQVNTLKFQLLYQVKRFEEADAIMSKIMVMEPMTLCMKMARQYKNDDPDLAKTFKKGSKRFKYEKGVMVIALYSWILVKQDKIDEAVELLAEAKEKIEHEAIQRNWQCLVNGKTRQFSNAAFGEQWYALHLETPKKQRASKGQLKGNPMAPKGKRRYF